MVSEIFELALSNGIWAVLFVFLLFYQIKDSTKRETKYLETIGALTNKLDLVEDIQKDVIEIKSEIKRVNKKVKKSEDI